MRKHLLECLITEPVRNCLTLDFFLYVANPSLLYTVLLIRSGIIIGISSVLVLILPASSILKDIPLLMLTRDKLVAGELVRTARRLLELSLCWERTEVRVIRYCCTSTVAIFLVLRRCLYQVRLQALRLLNERVWLNWLLNFKISVVRLIDEAAIGTNIVLWSWNYTRRMCGSLQEYDGLELLTMMLRQTSLSIGWTLVVGSWLRNEWVFPRVLLLCIFIDTLLLFYELRLLDFFSIFNLICRLVSASILDHLDDWYAKRSIIISRRKLGESLRWVCHVQWVLILCSPSLVNLM